MCSKIWSDTHRALNSESLYLQTVSSWHALLHVMFKLGEMLTSSCHLTGICNFYDTMKTSIFSIPPEKNDVFLLRDTVLHKFIRPPVVKKWENKSFFSKLHFIHFQSPLDILPFWTLKRNFKLNSHFYAQIWAESMFCSEKSEMNHNIQPASK